MSHVTKTLFGVGLTLCAFGLLAPAGRAEDAKPTAKSTQVQDFEKAIEAHLTGQKDTAALAADVQAIAKYAAQASDAEERKWLLNLVGRAIKVVDDPLRTACLKAFQQMKEPKAWEYYAFLLNQPDIKKMDPILHEAIDTCAVLVPEAAALRLIDIYRNSDFLPACVACLKALSKYKNSNQRAHILSEMIDEVKSIKPGVFGRFGQLHTHGRSGEAAQTRWNGLSGPVTENANALTGQSIGTIDDWIKTWDDMKSNLEQCFMEPMKKEKEKDKK